MGPANNVTDFVRAKDALTLFDSFIGHFGKTKKQN
jgi:hypothetical protein